MRLDAVRQGQPWAEGRHAVGVLLRCRDLLGCQLTLDEAAVLYYLFRFLLSGQHYAYENPLFRGVCTAIFCFVFILLAGPSIIRFLIRQKIGDRPAYLTYDIDSLDPAFAPGTGTVEVGGLTIWQALELVRGCKGLNLVGGDLVEVSPPYDPSGNTALIGGNLLYEMLCVLPKNGG